MVRVGRDTPYHATTINTVLADITRVVDGPFVNASAANACGTTSYLDLAPANGPEDGLGSMKSNDHTCSGHTPVALARARANRVGGRPDGVSMRADKVIGGYHEYIDVIVTDDAHYIVDINLVIEFEIVKLMCIVMLLRILRTIFVLVEICLSAS